MDFTGYDKKIRDLAEKIEVQYTLFDEGIFHNLGLLLGLAEEISDTALLGYVYYQLADAYYSFHFDVDSMQKYLSLGIKVQQEEEEYSLLAKSYNLLGITEFLRGNFGLSFDYFMSSLEYCKEIEPVDSSLRGIINSNIARLYFTLNDYDHGRYYAEEALYGGRCLSFQYDRHLCLPRQYLSPAKRRRPCSKSLHGIDSGSQ